MTKKDRIYYGLLMTVMAALVLWVASNLMPLHPIFAQSIQIYLSIFGIALEIVVLPFMLFYFCRALARGIDIRVEVLPKPEDGDPRPAPEPEPPMPPAVNHQAMHMKRPLP